MQRPRRVVQAPVRFGYDDDIHEDMAQDSVRFDYDEEGDGDCGTSGREHGSGAHCEGHRDRGALPRVDDRDPDPSAKGFEARLAPHRARWTARVVVLEWSLAGKISFNLVHSRTVGIAILCAVAWSGLFGI